MAVSPELSLKGLHQVLKSRSYTAEKHFKMSQWLRSKTQMTMHVGENVEKEHSSIAGGIANWYDHSGNQSGGSSEN